MLYHIHGDFDTCGAGMLFDEDDQMRRFRAAWDAVTVCRPVHYSLFTFGESVLPYYLVLAAGKPGGKVTLASGEVRITRPLIITPDNASPEFRNFFDDEDAETDMVQFLLARTAGFSHLRIDNASKQKRIVSDSVEEVVSKLNKQLDSDEEDRTAVLAAPRRLAGFALFRYAAERVMTSASDNIQELRERGFLPG